MRLLNSVLTVLFLSFMVSCSSDDSSDVVNGGGEDSFSFTIDGQQKNITQWSATKSERDFVVYGVADDGMAIQFIFNKYGNIGEISTFSIESFEVPSRYNHYYNRAEFFNFELVSVDEANHKVNVNYSGKVYDEDMDLTSDFSVVEGSFNLTYTEVQPQVSGLGLSATLNGQDWYGTTTSTSYEGGFGSTAIVSNNFDSDNEYGISVLVTSGEEGTGSYAFDEASNTNKIVVWGYDTENDTQVEYVTTAGTLNITERTDLGLGYTLIGGTFTATATNQETNDTVTITNGIFKGVYENW